MSGTKNIVPDWPAPVSVRAVSTTRAGGVSIAPYASLNLGDHVGDDPAAVRCNRRTVVEALALPCAPLWLQQVHGTRVYHGSAQDPAATADAAVAGDPGRVLVVQTADCLPVLFCDKAGKRIGVAHAGWRGLNAGVLEATLAAMALPAAEILVWLGPAIGPGAFEIGDEVRDAFVGQAADDADAFRRNRHGRWFGDLYALARNRLTRAGVTNIHGGGWCTFADDARFFSYRRDGRTGRMATMIWLQI